MKASTDTKEKKLLDNSKTITSYDPIVMPKEKKKRRSKKPIPKFSKYCFILFLVITTIAMAIGFLNVSLGNFLLRISRDIFLVGFAWFLIDKFKNRTTAEQDVSIPEPVLKTYEFPATGTRFPCLFPNGYTQRQKVLEDTVAGDVIDLVQYEYEGKPALAIINRRLGADLGVVPAKKHLREILRLAKKYKISGKVQCVNEWSSFEYIDDDECYDYFNYEDHCKERIFCGADIILSYIDDTNTLTP